MTIWNSKNTGGFSLIELIITIAIISIVLGIATMNFNQWQNKSRVEAQVKQMIADIGELRIKALTTKQRHSMRFTGTTYEFRSYSSSSEAVSAGTIIPGGTHSVTFHLQDASKTDFDGTVRYIITEQGMLESSTATLFLEYGGDYAAFDCLTIHTVRVNPGKKNAAGDTCNDK